MFAFTFARWPVAASNFDALLRFGFVWQAPTHSHVGLWQLLTVSSVFWLRVLRKNKMFANREEFWRNFFHEQFALDDRSFRHVTGEPDDRGNINSILRL